MSSVRSFSVKLDRRVDLAFQPNLQLYLLARLPLCPRGVSSTLFRTRSLGTAPRQHEGLRTQLWRSKGNDAIHDVYHVCPIQASHYTLQATSLPHAILSRLEVNITVSIEHTFHSRAGSEQGAGSAELHAHSSTQVPDMLKPGRSTRVIAGANTRSTSSPLQFFIAPTMAFPTIHFVVTEAAAADPRTLKYQKGMMDRKPGRGSTLRPIRPSAASSASV